MSLAHKASFLEEARTSQSSRYWSIRTPRSWSITDTGAMTLVDPWRAMERPTQRDMNWYTFPNATNQRNWRLSGCTGIWRYASIKLMETVQSPLRTARRTDWLVSIFNRIWRTNRFRWERLITGLHKPNAFQMTKRRCNNPERGELARLLSFSMRERISLHKAFPLTEFGE